MTIAELYDEAVELTADDQRRLNSMLVGLIRSGNQLRKVVALAGFKVGDKVMFKLYQRRLPHGTPGAVESIKRTRLSVKFEGYGVFGVDPGCIEKA